VARQAPRKPLHSAARQGNLALCKLLIEHAADPNLDYGVSNVSGPYTPLTDAVTDGNYEISKLLFEHGANPNVSGGRNQLCSV
jgi:ankyrin repeat protein